MPTSALCDRRPRLRRYRHVTTTVTVLAVLASGTGCSVLDRTPDPGPTVQRFVEDLRGGGVDGAKLTDPAQAEEAQRLLDDFGAALGTTPQFPLAGPVEITEAGRARARIRVRWRLTTGTWAYDATLRLRLVNDRWAVVWAPSVLHPRLVEGQVPAVEWTTPPRGPILSAEGEPLFEPGRVVTVNVQPRRVRDLDAVLGVLAKTLQIEPGPLREQVRAADPDHLVEVITLRIGDYAQLRSTLQPVPGLVFKVGERLLTPNRAFARALLGTVGRPTAEVLDEIGPGFTAADELGLSGLQRQFQRRLAGRPGLRVVVRDAQRERTTVLHEVPAVPGEALRTTLDPEVQLAADAALAGAGTTAALLALRASTGEVLAVANGPDGEGPDALAGRFPPGSAFSVVTTAALLDEGLSLEQPADCSAPVTIDRRRFRNLEGRSPARPVPFRTAFALSCTTAIARMAPEEDALRRASATFGFGGTWSPGVDAFTGVVRPLDGAGGSAATATGQHGVLASPLGMATVAAAVADGTWRPPVLLTDHADSGAGPRPLDDTTASALRTLMREVVASGTGAVLRDVPGGPVHAKTGTAPSDGQPFQHGWMIAYQGDIAIALYVEDGTGRRRAAPVAAEFFRKL
jgi:cell division protein FtsI/penicillin-binding protein 2